MIVLRLPLILIRFLNNAPERELIQEDGVMYDSEPLSDIISIPILKNAIYKSGIPILHNGNVLMNALFSFDSAWYLTYGGLPTTKSILPLYSSAI